MSQAAEDMIFCLEFLRSASAEYPDQQALARALRGALLMEASLDNLTSMLTALPAETQLQVGNDLKEILNKNTKGLH
jgi:hypothetical protein